MDPHLSNYCLVVTSGTQPHPSTLCAAQNVLKAHPNSSARTGSTSKEHHHRGVPEGLHCVRQTKLTLHRMRYDTTYNFTLYVVGLRYYTLIKSIAWKTARIMCSVLKKRIDALPFSFCTMFIFTRESRTRFYNSV